MCDDFKRAEIEQADRAYGAAVDNCFKDFFIKTGNLLLTLKPRINKTNLCKILLVYVNILRKF